jgi:hypothetical protein
VRRRIEAITRAFVRRLTGHVQAPAASPLPQHLASLLVLGRPTSFLRRPMMGCMAIGSVLHARYGFGEVRVATLALLIFTALSG